MCDGKYKVYSCNGSGSGINSVCISSFYEFGTQSYEEKFS